MHYFSCLGGTGKDSTKSALGHVTMNLCFCIRSLHLGCETTTHHFSLLGGIGTDSRKGASRHVTLNFLHPVGSTGHVVRSGASEVRNLDTLFSMLGWVQCYFHKKRARTRHAKLVFLHPVGYAGHVVHSSASGL
jgi:hypothetical protein